MVGFSRRVFLCIVVFVVAIRQPCSANEMKERSEEVTNTLVLAVKHILDKLIEDVRLAKIKNAVKTSVQNSSAIPWDTTYRANGEEPKMNTPAPEDNSPNAVGMLLMSEFIVEDNEPEVLPQDNFKTTVQRLLQVPVRSWQENETHVEPLVVIDANTGTPVAGEIVLQESARTLLQDATLDTILLPPLNATPDMDIPVAGETLLQDATSNTFSVPQLNSIDDMDISVAGEIVEEELDAFLLPWLNTTVDDEKFDDDLPVL